MENPIVIVSAARTPMGHYGGYFKEMPAPELGAAVIKAVVERAGLQPAEIDEVIMGCVLPAGQGQAPARQAALKAGLPVSTPCTTINKMCGSGMKAIMLAHDEILADSYPHIIAGGMENMSRAPYLMMKARFGYRLGHDRIYDHMMLDGLEDAYDKGKAMGVFAEKCVDKYQFTREALDKFAIESLLRAKKANENGSFAPEIVPITITHQRETLTVDHDENAMKANPEKIPQLKPVFKADGAVTAANSSSISDGAAAVTLMRLSEAKRLNIQPLAKIIGHFTYAEDPSWFTTAPIGAIRGLLKKISWKKEAVDLFEINEAFAAVTMAAMKEIGLAHNKVNIHGGACALGHPIGASGARILVTLLYALQKNNLQRGIASLCIGGGEATAIAIERGF
ncbi:acetyl-CoA C-acyltransferase [Coxiella burnetii]|uniref:Acetyl-CoA acetyltransferase n=1 Tax=Coxiella burnetii (strain RSA 493 / Nine Mile phase I) TaxID=227377 RepID=Q83CX7_COXBU|nr:acetyl-CoA C-acyltransferase [Coxiella burnetii]NP_819982.1 acetyl-CoA acetyltransferase [Coxiella burnetii RSA 493]AAO90496.1 acetyl-CoA acetyltransferase [Coxiella burnetii RSA 493]ABX78677.1 acetyl-CoA acetyltransferase [Coxiella burnetii RSA 331]AML49264.1 acetyl-CoA acetyltransferase [Coxiella burnetii]AML55199.1 acetyl-CoA acetyltransferase [Coxiella burnetii]ARI65799.1 acetyl-CoA acetyltransferase [Coxiella burnetii]